MLKFFSEVNNVFLKNIFSKIAHEFNNVHRLKNINKYIKFPKKYTDFEKLLLGPKMFTISTKQIMVS
jgi:hypothetical protein